MNKTRIIIWSLIIAVGLFLTSGIKISKGQDFVPVKDAEVIRLLRWLVEKELGDSNRSDRCQRRIANQRLFEASKYIVNLIKYLGRKTEPTDLNSVYVKNWRGFLSRGQYRGEDVTRGVIADATLGADPKICNYLRRDLNTVFTVTDLPAGFDSTKYRLDSIQYYKLHNACTLPNNFNLNQFRNSFDSGGGWNTWDEIIKPQNNFYGVHANTEEELKKQRGFEEGLDREEVGAGSGYLGRTECLVIGQNGECLAWKNIEFPANVAAEALGAVINQNLAWITGSDEVDELLDVYVFEVVNAIFGVGKFRGDDGSAFNPSENPSKPIRDPCVNRDPFTDPAKEPRGPFGL